MAGIEDTHRALAKDLESKWGFVIYRTTYTDDAEWKLFINRITYGRLLLDFVQQLNKP
jgi:hypothetical protein